MPSHSETSNITDIRQSLPLNNRNELPRLLLVDDDKDMLTMLQKVIQRKCDCRIKLAESGEEALTLLHSWNPDVVLTDIKMSGIDGLTVLRKIKDYDDTVSVIMMSGHATIDLAVNALKEGAYDFFEKPFDNELVIHAVKRTLERTILLRENSKLNDKLMGREPFYGFTGRSKPLCEIFNLITKIADTDVTALIRGESGTGKELAAKAIHALSSRAKRQMVIVNCPALPEHILESELFGFSKGAFTDATHDKKGLFLEADGSTIVLDEIGDIPLSLQTKLLRVLQEKEIQPLGQTKRFKVDVRVLASTNQDLEKKIRQGLFREDLFYRLNVVTIPMPSLRSRPEDIPILAQHFLDQLGKEYQRQGLVFSKDALSYLIKYKWPGNVRELQNTVKRAVLLANQEEICPRDLQNPNDTDGIQPFSDLLHQLPYNDAKDQAINTFSRQYLSNVLKQSGGNVTAAARASGLGRQALQRLMKRYDLQSTSFRPANDGY